MHATHRPLLPLPRKQLLSADIGAVVLGAFMPRGFARRERISRGFIPCGFVSRGSVPRGFICGALCGGLTFCSAIAFAQPAPWTMESEGEPVSGGAATPAAPASAAPRALVRGEEAALTELPRNISVFTYHRELVSRMLRQSPTFKRQCARIAKASVTLSVELREAPPGATQGARAQTFIANRRDGTAEAQIFLNSDHRASSVELIAHEFEHILEWLDGVDYDRGERSGQVRGSLAGALETRRAIAVGQQVVREMRADRETRDARDTTVAGAAGPM